MNSTPPAAVIRAHLLMARVFIDAADKACGYIAHAVGCDIDDAVDVIFNNADPDDFLRRYGFEETRHDA